VGESLLSVGIDVGTSTTQLIVSRLTVENRANAYAVPDLDITGREILYESPIHFTPLKDAVTLDAPAIREIVAEEYQNAGIQPERVKTGAIIITGETARKSNARLVLENLKAFAGAFVVATAGPDLEGVLAAKGSGAVRWSAQTGKTVLHMDIGGGTSNMALIEGGNIVSTGCLNVGGRLIRVEGGRIRYLSPVLNGLCRLSVGDTVEEETLRPVVKMLVEALEIGCGYRAGTVSPGLITDRVMTLPPGEVTFSFSGGVGELLDTETEDPFCFGDIGPMLASEIRRSSLCRGDYFLGEQTIRATVIGAGCYSTQLSGSTVYARNMDFPLSNLPVISLSREEQELNADDLRRRLEILSQRYQRQTAAIYLPGLTAPGFDALDALAGRLAKAITVLPKPHVIVSGTDMGKALGQALATRIEGGILSLDGLRLQGESYLDVGAPVSGGAAYPVVKKTLVLG